MSLAITLSRWARNCMTRRSGTRVAVTVERRVTFLDPEHHAVQCESPRAKEEQRYRAERQQAQIAELMKTRKDVHTTRCRMAPRWYAVCAMAPNATPSASSSHAV